MRASNSGRTGKALGFRADRSPRKGAAASAALMLQLREGRGQCPMVRHNQPGSRGSCALVELLGKETRLNERVGVKKSLGEHSGCVGVFK